MSLRSLSNVTESLPRVSWRRVFENTGSLRGFLIRIFLAVTGYVTKEGAICSLFIARRVINLRKSGLLYTSLYLKQCLVHLQQYYASSSSMVGQPAVRVSLSRDGLPRIIPKHHRSLIRKRGVRGHYLVRLYLSWFSVCRIILLAKRTSKATFESIIAPSRLSGAQVILNGEFKRLFPSFSACIFHGSPTFPFSRELVGNRLGNLLRTMTVGSGKNRNHLHQYLRL